MVPLLPAGVNEGDHLPAVGPVQNPGIAGHDHHAGPDHHGSAGVGRLGEVDRGTGGINRGVLVGDLGDGVALGDVIGGEYRGSGARGGK